MTTSRRLLFALLTVVLAVGLTACGGGEDTTTTEETGEPTTAASPTEEETAPAATGETVEITGVDYAFEGVPASVEAGTALTFTNGSEDEFHEMAVLRIDDDEDRSVEELLQIPEEEAEQVTEFVGVQVAPPGEQGTSPPGAPEGPVVLEEPGRYALLCFIPTGADPEVIADAMEAGGTEEPDIGGGPPHFTQGMAAELTVTE